MSLNTPKRIRTLANYENTPPLSGSGDNSSTASPYQNSAGSSIINNGPWVDGSLSPISSCGSPEFAARPNGNCSSHNSSLCNSLDKESKRGRPRSESLTTLMMVGSTSPSAIKCTFCNRVFPREKSLQAHLRTHTGERPYTCDYPGCTRAFTQSGQLKTHQRLHTGERPFICSAPTCQMRFTHANRHCPDHPYVQLKRCDDFVIQTVPEHNIEVLKWLEKYRLEKEVRTPTRKTPKRNRQINIDSDNNENLNAGLIENVIESPVTPNNPYKSRKGLMVELDMNAGMGNSSPIATKTKAQPKIIQWQEPLSQGEESADEEDDTEAAGPITFNPKKRWLREAWQDDLAKPLEPVSQYDELVGNSLISDRQSVVVPHHPALVIASPKKVNPNHTRPTVLMVACKNSATPLTEVSSERNIAIKSNLVGIGSNESHAVPPNTNRKWLGALALMQLSTEENKNDNMVNRMIHSYTQL